MDYILEVKNKFNYGHRTFVRSSLSEIKEILNDNLFDGDVKLYERREIPLPCNYDKVDDYEFTEMGHALLRIYAYVDKKYIKDK